MIEEMLKKAVEKYVPKDRQGPALVTFRGVLAAAKAEGSMFGTAEITEALAKVAK